MADGTHAELGKKIDIAAYFGQGDGDSVARAACFTRRRRRTWETRKKRFSCWLLGRRRHGDETNNKRSSVVTPVLFFINCQLNMSKKLMVTWVFRSTNAIISLELAFKKRHDFSAYRENEQTFGVWKFSKINGKRRSSSLWRGKQLDHESLSTTSPLFLQMELCDFTSNEHPIDPGYWITSS